eukprot:snap_masked-scaffold_22-processed-gene-2.24-mRNA-1 protein AED:1.00 eAED:1.00 QI:0/0/0/0/1/1/2/0/68
MKRSKKEFIWARERRKAYDILKQGIADARKRYLMTYDSGQLYFKTQISVFPMIFKSWDQNYYFFKKIL